MENEEPLESLDQIVKRMETTVVAEGNRAKDAVLSYVDKSHASESTKNVFRLLENRDLPVEIELQKLSWLKQLLSPQNMAAVEGKLATSLQIIPLKPQLFHTQNNRIRGMLVRESSILSSTMKLKRKRELASLEHLG